MSKNDRESFNFFINFILNDLVYLLDESLKSLNSIRESQAEQKSTNGWSNLQPAARREREENFRRTEGQTNYCMRLANATVRSI
jgi:hypothetical protein